MFDDDYDDGILDDEDTSAEEGEEDDELLDDEEQNDDTSSDDTDDEDQDDGEGTKDKNAEAKFTQDDVNKIVQKRLRKNEAKIKAEYENKLQGYGMLNEIIDDLHEYGYEGTPEEISKVLKKQVKDLKMQQGMSEAEYDYMQSLKSLNKKVDSLIKEKTDADVAAKQQAKQQAEFQEQVDELETTYKDKGITVEKLRHDPKFVKFNKIADPRLTLKQVLDLYLEMNGDAEAEAIAKIKLNSKRSTHSGKGVGGDDGTYGLSKDEIELVREFNKENPDHKMSFKEFANRKHK